jgi:DNA-binding NarL/FixJ family response regulator
MQGQRETNHSSPTAHIIVADDYAQWRTQVRSILRARPDWQIVCEVCDGSQAVLKAAELRPHIVLLDIAMPVVNGIEAAKQIRQGSPGCKILFLTQNGDREIEAAALQTGAEGYVLKARAGSDLVPSIAAALRDGDN